MSKHVTDDDILKLAKIIDGNCHEYLSASNAKWPEPAYIFWNEKRERSITLAKKILDAGYRKIDLDIF